MGNCWVCLADVLIEADSIPVPTTIDHLNPDIPSICESACQIEESTNITWPSQVSSSSSATENNQITSHQIAYEAGTNLRVFTHAQLKIATHNFRRHMVIGRGGFGKVFKGGLKEKLPSHGFKRLMPSQAPHKLIFAVKQLDSSSKQGFREWLSDLNILGSLSHPNLVKLFGYSIDKGKFFLASEFVPNGSLNYHLFGKRSVRPLPWHKRLHIICGVARALT